MRFIRELEAYLGNEKTRFRQFNWWLFSKSDETLDQMYIPYYDPETSRIRQFNPDFIFWLERSIGLTILQIS